MCVQYRYVKTFASFFMFIFSTLTIINPISALSRRKVYSQKQGSNKQENSINLDCHKTIRPSAKAGDVFRETPCLVPCSGML